MFFSILRRIVFVLACASVCLGASALDLSDLKCEYRRNPLGIDTSNPRLSWIINSSVRGERQRAYQVLAATSPSALAPGKADLWDSGKVVSSDTIQIAYQGAKLKSGQRVYWTVRVWGLDGKPSRFAVPVWFETALLSPKDWQAQWITHSREIPPKDLFDDIPAPLFRKAFTATRAIRQARLYVSGLGYYEARINGKRVGDHVLDPGWTAYAKRVLYSTYDVTDLLRPGKNVIGAMLGNGWYNPLPLRFWGHINIREHLTIGEPRLLAQLQITYNDGSKETIPSDKSWKTEDGPILRNNLYLGETYDARKEQIGWDQPGFDDSHWRAAGLASKKLGALSAQQAPPIRIKRTLKPKAITEPEPGVFIVDLGQNIAGWARLRVKGAAGTKVTLRFGELLNKDGTLNAMTSVAGQIKAGGTDYVYEGNGYPKTAWQQDTYILKGDPRGEEWMPRFTFHGFRYIEVKGYPGKLDANEITGLLLHSDVEPAGEFTCSNELFNRIQEMVLWTELSNLFSVQSDCPHREKFGYGGDIVAASEMGMFNFDMATFYSKAVRDLGDDVRPNGGFTETAPFVGIADEGFGQKSGPIGWGTAHPLLQAQLLQYYGERDLAEQQYTNTKRWLALLKSAAKDGVLDKGISDHESIAPKPRALTGTGFYYMNARLIGRLARELGKTEEAFEAEKLAEEIREAFNSKFLDRETGRYGEGTQASQAFALYLGLVPKELETKVLDVLVRDVVHTNKGHLTTGIFGTKFMLNALTDYGRADVAFQIANQQTYPGWGYMLENGATTLWEHWAFSDNTFSHNHPMFGSVSEWFFKGMAGISPSREAVGFDRIMVRPPSLESVDHVKARYNSVRGKIVSEWSRKGDRFELRVSIPVGCTAEIWIPGGTPERTFESGKPAIKAKGVKSFRREGRNLVLQCAAGTYKFQRKNN